MEHCISISIMVACSSLCFFLFHRDQSFTEKMGFLVIGISSNI
jgi:hypothetical protein